MSLERRHCQELTSEKRTACPKPGNRTCSCSMRVCVMHLRYHARNFKHTEVKELRGC